jgi:hypothetical protein
MGRYDNQIATAQRLIQKDGQAVILRRMTDGTPADPAQPWKPGAPTVIDEICYIVFIPENRVNYETLHTYGITAVPRGNLVGLMAVQAFVPKLKDRVIRGSQVYTIETIDTLAPNDQTILYTMGLAE